MQNSLFSSPFSSAPASWESLPLPDADLSYLPGYYSPDQSRQLFNALLNSTPWRQDKLNFRGKQVQVPRLQAWYGDKNAMYGYSGLALVPLQWTDLLLDIKARLETTVNHSFNSVLLNLYRNGQDSVAWHSDDEQELGRDPIIASLSLGATRCFELKPKSPATASKSTITLEDGSLLLMGKGLQQHWMHQLPKEAGINKARINLTFRFVRPMA